MKRKLFMAAMMAVGTTFAGCTSDESVSAMQEDAISFNIVNGGGTRATPTTSSNYLSQVSNFQVWGYFAAGATGDGVTAGARYIGSSETQGLTIVGDGSGAWDYSSNNEKMYWPPTTAPLNFQAVTPASDASFTISNTVSGNLPHVVANVTVPTSNASQKDIMFASSAGVTKSTSSGKVNLAFKHALSQIAFSATTAKTSMTADIGEITLCNICNTGKVGFISSNDLSFSTTTTSVTSYSLGLVSDKSVTSASKNMTADNGVLLLLPQTTTAWTTSNNITTANTNKQTYLKISCKILDGGVYLVGTSSAYATIYIPFAASWEQGKKYNYTLVFGSGSGGYDENGSAQLVPLSFTVSAADWTAVDGGAVPPAPTTGTENGYAWVDLGLPSGLKWATCNVGASNPEDAGLYFAWGETTGYTAEQVTAGEHSFSGTVYDRGPAASISADLTLEQDAARANLGGNWRMPTKEDCQELIDNCDVTWTTDYNSTGIAGRVFTSKVNGNSVFFPAAGGSVYYNFNGNPYSGIFNQGSVGHYWSASWISEDEAISLHSNSENVNTPNEGRSVGLSVRGVCE